MNKANVLTANRTQDREKGGRLGRRHRQTWVFARTLPGLHLLHTIGETSWLVSLRIEYAYLKIFGERESERCPILHAR